MKKRLYIGIYIGSGDTDIAAWFNLLQVNNLPRSKWVRGLLMAYTLGQSLYIGTVSPDKPLIEKPKYESSNSLLVGTGHSASFSSPPKGRYTYGWHIRGANREVITGSVINISIGKPEELPILRELKENDRQLATFVKALIRRNLCYGEENLPPVSMDLQQLRADFVLRQAKVPSPLLPCPDTPVRENNQELDSDNNLTKTAPQLQTQKAPEQKKETEHEIKKLPHVDQSSHQRSEREPVQIGESNKKHFRNPLLDRI